jgi:hypothetical protein
MCVAVIFCADPEQKRRQNENRRSFLGRGEEESLPEAIEFKMPACFQRAIPSESIVRVSLLIRPNTN